MCYPCLQTFLAEEEQVGSHHMMQGIRPLLVALNLFEISGIVMSQDIVAANDG
jgi:hypothetical protein